MLQPPPHGVQNIGNFGSFPSDSDEYIWAVKDVSFEIKRGDAVGIIGPNGAGKSTILKLLSRITTPTEGKIIVDGRIASLIDVGAGFHPQLTGRENIYLNGSIVGMKKHEIMKRFDDIVAFSEIEQFIDTPVKRYSSGMYARLGFAVAAHIRADILLIDEVLSVGDVGFQTKCIKKMEEYRQAGTTIVFVSHNLSAVQNLCNKTIVLNHSQVQFNGPTEKAVVYYQKLWAESLMGQNNKSKHKQSSKRSEVEILQIDLFDKDRIPAIKFSTGDIAFVVLKVRFYKDLDSLRFALIIKKPDGSVVFDTDSGQLGTVCGKNSYGDSFKVEFKLRMNLLSGLYNVIAHIKPYDFSCYYYYSKEVITFEVKDTYSWQGVAHLDPKVRILEKIENK